MSAAPAKDKKQIVVVSIFGVLLLVFVVYAYNSFFGGSPNPAATAPPVSAPVVTRSSESSVETETTTIPAGNARAGQSGAAPGVAAKRMASTSSSLDPTLDESAMLRTESLVYSGSGRNIFSAISAPLEIPVNVPKARPGVVLPVLPPMPVGPPPPPPINLKYFGTAVRVNGRRQAFLLQGEDVYLASEGDIVARKYRIMSIGTNNIQVEDLVNKDTQTLPLVGR
jgi:hypothetical protein